MTADTFWGDDGGAAWAESSIGAATEWFKTCGKASWVKPVKSSELLLYRGPISGSKAGGRSLRSECSCSSSIFIMKKLSLCVVAASLLFYTGESADTTVTCGAHVHRLSCDNGVISVDKAFYGRADSDTCAGGKTPEEVANTACSHADALQVLQTRCNGKEWCELNAGVFAADPCSDTFKYMKTSYSCVPAIHRVVCEHSMAHLQCGKSQEQPPDIHHYPNSTFTPKCLCRAQTSGGFFSDAGQTIKVLGADFGRRDHVTCAFRRDPALVQKIDCSNPAPVVAEKCDGKNQCEVRVSEMVVEQSCANTSLYLEYSYTCS
ncbi:L-rhamnose-binding lectin SML-like [Periophthalmus magnuspinnatus]|uniref:L-rhamnose-binding lectin SML-like n=1 Tax=Periophthalmus magnuspinnatus TaxID=409849 RepID=UPI002436807D|nr:L-rhamnose-binding lectin SML-like [Periophthalmus magnuspinnatus]